MALWLSYCRRYALLACPASSEVEGVGVISGESERQGVATKDGMRPPCKPPWSALGRPCTWNFRPNNVRVVNLAGVVSLEESQR